MTCLASFGPVFVAAALPVAYFVIKIYKTLVTIKNYEVKNTHTPGAQTTHLVSSGPVFIVVALPVTYFNIRIYKTLVCFKEKRKKPSPRAQTMRLAQFGPFSVVATFHTLLVAYFIDYNLYT